MNQIKSSELKTILHSKRVNIYYLEHCRLLVNGGRVEYVTDEGNQSLYWNIPIANTITILLGSGTSVTQAAMRELSRAGVLVGFTGGGGTPLYSSTEVEIDIKWLSPQSEYRTNEYLQNWIRLWIDDNKRLLAAKQLQKHRINFIRECWLDSRFFKEGIILDISLTNKILQSYYSEIDCCLSISDIFSVEAQFTKQLYKVIAKAVEYPSFSRVKQGNGTDPANKNLDRGNYLAYGLGATATWVLGLPHGLSILHGKTRRGGLVFDAADLIKDALVLPQAFITAVNGEENADFKAACICNFLDKGALDYIIESLKQIAELGAEK